MPPEEVLIEAKDSLFRSWIKESSKVRGPLKKLNDKIQRRLKDKAFTRAGEKLLKAEADKLDKLVRSELDKAFSEVDLELRKAVERAADRAVRSQKKYLKRAGIKLESNKVISEARARAMKVLDAEFPSDSGLSYKDRLRIIRMRHERALRSNIRREFQAGMAKNAIARDTSLRLTAAKMGVRTPVLGGSAAKQVSRVMVAEEARISQEVEKQILRAHGIELAYWRLSPDHRWEGGSEICEVIAAGIGKGVDSAARRADIGVTVTEGLYLVSEWPDYPHPYCKCHMEPLL